MFSPVVFEVEHQLLFGEANLLAVVIDPAPQEQSQVGYTSRVRTGKSRMSYGWDFCPRLVHLGIWDRVYLEDSGPVAIRDVFVQPVLSHHLDQAVLNIQLNLDSRSQQLVDLGIRITGPDGGEILKQKTVEAMAGKSRFQEKI